MSESLTVSLHRRVASLSTARSVVHSEADFQFSVIGPSTTRRTEAARSSKAATLINGPLATSPTGASTGVILTNHQ